MQRKHIKLLFKKGHKKTVLFKVPVNNLPTSELLLLMVKKFEYIRAGLWYRPIIPVTLRYGKQEVSYLALIDSGADFNIFHSDIASIF